MTQDQYGQAQDAGYGVRGNVVEDENDGNEDSQAKPMNRLQKVASALRGDRADRDEMDNDQAAGSREHGPPWTRPGGHGLGDTTTVSAARGHGPGGHASESAPAVGTAAPPTAAAADSDVVASSGTGPAPMSCRRATGRGRLTRTQPTRRAARTLWTPRMLAVRFAPTSPLARRRTRTGPFPRRPDARTGTTGTADPNGTGATAGLGAEQGDYWDDSDAQVAGEVEAVAVTTPDAAVTDADVDPLAGQDADAYPLAGQDETASQTSPDVPDASLAGTQDPGYQDRSAYQDPAGAATISDVPVRQDGGGRRGHRSTRPYRTARRRSRAGSAPGRGDRHAGRSRGPGLREPAAGRGGFHRAMAADPVQVRRRPPGLGDRGRRGRRAGDRQAGSRHRRTPARHRGAPAGHPGAPALATRPLGRRREADTETLRETLRMYRAFLDQLIGSKA